MKKYYIILIAFLGCLGLQAKDMTGLKIYINPGHGGYDSDDRNVAVYPYAQGDTLGFWESSSNLHKGLMLRELLQEQGATVAMSRVYPCGDDISVTHVHEVHVIVYVESVRVLGEPLFQ